MNAENKTGETEKKDVSKEKQKDPCMRCGAPVEVDGDILCKKCEGEVH